MRLVDRVGVCPSRLTLKVCLSCGEVDSSFLPLARLVGRMRAAVTALGLCTRRLIQSGNLWSGGSFASSSAAKNILFFFTLAISKRSVLYLYVDDTTAYSHCFLNGILALLMNIFYGNITVPFAAK